MKQNKMPKLIVFSTLLQLLWIPVVSSQFTVSGSVSDGNGFLVDARITLFNEGLSTFFEGRTNQDGEYVFNNIPGGNFTIGATALAKDYKKVETNILADLENLNFFLDEESHSGRWQVIMQSPEALGGTDLGVLLPNGKIFYCHDSKDPFLFDPEINDTLFITGDNKIQGCVAPGLMLSGELIFFGGTDRAIYGPGTKLVKTFDFKQEVWKDQNGLMDFRWYPSMTQLADGNLLIIGGGGLDNPTRVRTSEVYNPLTFTTTQVGDIAIGNEVSPSVLLYTGEILMTHRPPQLYNPNAAQWRLAADFMQGNRMANGDHSDHELILLPDGKVVAIGYKSFDNSALGNLVEIYDPSSDRWSLGEHFSPVRSRAKTVLLPTKKILVMGGEKENPSDPTPTNQWNYMKLTDLYDPYKDSWRRLEDLHIAREYHCTTILVPDGRIIAVGGEGAPGNEPIQSTIEAFEPPYLFKGVRPEIHDLTSKDYSRGEAIGFRVEKTNSPTSVLLMSLQSVTHFMNTGNNRFLDLDFSQSNDQIIAQIPEDSLTAVPGYYMLFVMVDDIPSIAEIIKINKEQIITNTGSFPTENEVIIYPNPTNNKVLFEGMTRSRIEIYNAMGHRIDWKVVESNELDLSLYPTGMYYLKVFTGARERTFKVIKN